MTDTVSVSPRKYTASVHELYRMNVRGRVDGENLDVDDGEQCEPEFSAMKYEVVAMRMTWTFEYITEGRDGI